MEVDNSFNDVEPDVVDDGFGGDEDFHHEVPEEREKGDIVESQGLKKMEVVPVLEGSVGSSCGSHRSKLRLCVEMSIKTKMAGGKAIPDEGDKPMDVDPVMVVVDYPDDVVVSVNAKIQRLDKDISISSSEDAAQVQKGWKNDNRKEMPSDENDNKLLESTFVKVPLSSTLIYPILEELETSDVQRWSNQGKVANPAEGKSVRKSNSGDASLYQTVMGDNGEEFGNISEIVKMDSENIERVSEDQVSSNNVIFGKHPSLKLNSSQLLFNSEKTTPAEKLVKALHILARYRGVWGIYEDETRIVKHLTYLNRLLTITDASTVHKTCLEEDYLEVRGLISYFTLEKRFEIRSELLQTFTLLSQKSRAVSAFICGSEIPVVLAREVETGDYTSRETYAYASYLLQMITGMQLSEAQCEEIGEKFYGCLCTMIIKAEKNQHGSMAEIIFEILLHYHQQLGDSDLKWQSLFSAAENRIVMKKIKQKLSNALLRNASLSPRSEERSPPIGSEGKIKEILLTINDWIVCNATQDLFSNAELDIILVTLIHNLENSHFTEFHREALKTIHRILLAIKTEPSGLDKLERLVIKLLKDFQESGSGDYDRCYRGVLKKIYKIVSFS